jgi:hypothetical protein
VTAAGPVWGATPHDPALRPGGLGCCDGEWPTRFGDSLTEPQPGIFHSRGCPLRGPNGERGPIAPRPDVTALRVIETEVASIERRRRSASREWAIDRRRSAVGELAERGLCGLAIARKLNEALSTVRRDMQWLRDHGWAGPPVKS